MPLILMTLRYTYIPNSGVASATFTWSGTCTCTCWKFWLTFIGTKSQATGWSTDFEGIAKKCRVHQIDVPVSPWKDQWKDISPFSPKETILQSLISTLHESGQLKQALGLFFNFLLAITLSCKVSWPISLHDALWEILTCNYIFEQARLNLLP